MITNITSIEAIDDQAVKIIIECLQVTEVKSKADRTILVQVNILQQKIKACRIFSFEKMVKIGASWDVYGKYLQRYRLSSNPLFVCLITRN